MGPMDLAEGGSSRLRTDVPARTILLELASSFAWLTAVGLIAIGASGLLAGGMSAALGARFVAGDPPGMSYPADRCAEFLEYAPQARTCEEAATTHHDWEVIYERIAAGVLGLVVLGGYLLARRRGWTGTPHLPAAFTTTVGASVFGLAAAALLLISLNQTVVGQTAGVGADFSGGIVSAVVAAGFGISLLRGLFGSGREAAARR